MCRAAFITEVLDYLATSVLGLQLRMPELRCLKESVHQTENTFIVLTNVNALLFTKVPYDQQRLEALVYLSLTYRFIFFISLFT